MIDTRDRLNLPTGASLTCLLVRVDMPIESAYYAASGLIPYVLEQVASAAPGKETREVRVA